LVSTGIYDSPYWDFLGKTIRPGDRVVEVGANIGLFTVRLARLVGRFGHVWAWEPDAELAALARDNLQANWLTEHAIIVEGAVSNKTGQQTFNANLRLRMLGSLSEEADGPAVQVQRLDEALRADLPIHLVKIDVEGGEAAVLEGMSGLLEAGCVRMIDVEIIRDNAGASWPRLVTAMRGLVDLYGAEVLTHNRDGSTNRVPLDSVIAKAGHHPHVLFLFPTRFLGRDGSEQG
jgi:FkbM family methyltransferase